MENILETDPEKIRQKIKEDKEHFKKQRLLWLSDKVLELSKEIKGEY